jgi:hypothetical protein
MYGEADRHNQRDAYHGAVYDRKFRFIKSSSVSGVIFAEIRRVLP